MIRSIKEPFLSQDIDYLILSAREGDLISTCNLLTFFCTCVKRAVMPPQLLSSFVVEVLEIKFSEKKRKIQYRNKSIHNEMFRQLSSSRRSSQFAVSIKVSRQHYCSISKVASIYKHLPDTCVIDFCDAVKKNQLNDKLLEGVSHVVHKIIKELLNPSGSGKAQRHKLNLRGFGQWNSSKELHTDLLQEVEKHGVVGTARKFDIKVDTIKKIRKRNKHRGTVSFKT